MPNLYSIRDLKTGLYFQWVDDHWYGTTKDSTPRFTSDKMQDAVENLKHHYVSGVTVTDETGYSKDIPFHVSAKIPVPSVSQSYSEAIQDDRKPFNPVNQEPYKPKIKFRLKKSFSF